MERQIEKYSNTCMEIIVELEISLIQQENTLIELESSAIQLESYRSLYVYNIKESAPYSFAALCN